MNIITQLKEKGLSKYRIAKSLEPRVHWATVHRWENEIHQPNEEHMRQLKKLLKESGV